MFHSQRDCIISFGDLFMAPNFDELEEVALDSHGQPKKLTSEQFKSVQERGYVEHLYMQIL